MSEEDLENLIEETRQRVKNMTPEEVAELHLQARRSWAIGDLRIRYPDMSLEHAEQIVDGVIKKMAEEGEH